MNLFARPFFLVAIIPVLLTVLLLLWVGAALKRRILRTLFSLEIYQKLMGAFQPVSRWRNACLAGSFLFLLLALAAPQWGTEIVQAQGSFAQTIIAVDVSASMRAQDLKPDRLDNAKTMLKMLISNLKDERIGLIAFTSIAQVQCPITTDQDALNYFVNALRPDMFPVPGTSISAPILRSAQMLAKYPGKKAVILLTDGEDHAPEELEQAQQAALKNNIRIIAIGIGSKEGALVPETWNESGQVVSYKKDKKGNSVVSKLDDASLMKLAQATGGVFIPYTTPARVATQVEEQIRQLDKTTSATSRNVTYKNRYQFPLFLALVCLAAYVLWPMGRKKKLSTDEVPFARQKR